MAVVPADSSNPSGPNSAQPLAGIRVLLVEDSADNQRFLTYLLRKRGASVAAVGNGRLCVEALTDDGTIGGRLREPPPFDIVLMDMQMPEMDGYTATSLLRNNGCRLPILAVTAHAMVTDRELCLSAGCDEYLTKPVEFQELERVLVNLLSRASVAPRS